MSLITYDEYLAHFGVKGMKWGVRNSDKKQARSLKKAQKKWDKGSTKAYINANNTVALRENSGQGHMQSANKQIDSVLKKAGVTKASSLTGKNLDEYNKICDDYMQAVQNDVMTEFNRTYGKRPE